MASLCYKREEKTVNSYVPNKRWCQKSCKLVEAFLSCISTMRRDIAVAIQSVCPSVRPPVTFWHCAQMTANIIQLFCHRVGPSVQTTLQSSDGKPLV